MISWLKLNEDKWLFKKGDATKELNSFKQLYLWSSFSGISDDEIIAARMELNTNFHNYAEFGMCKKFVYTTKI